jgi:hypothetical protein
MRYRLGEMAIDERSRFFLREQFEGHRHYLPMTICTGLGEQTVHYMVKQLPD